MPSAPKGIVLKKINQQKRRRLKGLIKKTLELHDLCDYDVTLFVRDHAKNQRKKLVCTKDAEWRKTFDSIDSIVSMVPRHVPLPPSDPKRNA